VTAQPVQAAGPTCTVGTSGADYTTIQAAANDNGCTTINIAAGTYTENVTFAPARDVTINGSATDSTVVDGNLHGTVFTVRSDGSWPVKAVTFNRLTIQNGAGREGGDVYLHYADGTLIDSTIANNSRGVSGEAYSGEIAATSGTITLQNTIVAGGCGGANVTYINSGNNLDGMGGCNVSTVIDPKLAPNGLQPNGGPNATLALIAGSY